jgi:hypothetical protein
MSVMPLATAATVLRAFAGVMSTASALALHFTV